MQRSQLIEIKNQHYKFIKSDSDDYLKRKKTLGVPLLPYPVNFEMI